MTFIYSYRPIRKFDDLAKSIPAEIMGHVRRFPFLKTKEEVASFVKFCEESEHKKLRGNKQFGSLIRSMSLITIADWIIDKKSSPWFVPSVNEFMSKIPEDDWYLTPGDTNLNESAHPHTNMHTGTNLPIIEAIVK